MATNQPQNDFKRALTGKGVDFNDGLRIVRKNTKKVKLGQVWRKHGALGYRRQRGGEI